MKLNELLEKIQISNFTGDKEKNIQGISYTSKTVQKDHLFAALKGEKSDGHDYIQEALDKRAAAVLSERAVPENFKKTWIQVKNAREALALMAAAFHSNPSKKLKVVGITGTKGKTTITYLIENILKKARCSPGVIGTISYRGPEMEISAERTTPEAPDLQNMIKDMLTKGATHCLIEVSSHSLELNRVTGIDFDVVIFTNLSGEHLDYHISMENYFEAKKKLFKNGTAQKTAVVNIDDQWGKKLTSHVSGKLITYGMNSGANVRTEKVVFTEKGITFSIKHPEGFMTISSPLPGKPNLYNILASTAAALALKISDSAIKEGIQSLSGVPGRFEKIENSQGLNIFVDYAHTDDALKNLLETAREICTKKIILVFGAGGDRDKGKRPRMGKIAGKLADWTILTSDNPRSENPHLIISDIKNGINESGAHKYEVQPDRKKAIKKALAIGEKGDFILIAGKGHETYQVIENKVYPFDDREVVREVLSEMEKR
jgi:UDP-N-acetylmuramoyl-L-alanyl-D-glutamate--2,6-diaminopimelate ligase